MHVHFIISNLRGIYPLNVTKHCLYVHVVESIDEIVHIFIIKINKREIMSFQFYSFFFPEIIFAQIHFQN